LVDTKITDLSLATAALLDELVINDVTDTSDKKVTPGSIIDLITGNITVDSSGVSALAANVVDSSELVDGSIDTSHIADKQITLAKMADGTDGELITWSATGVIAAVAVGTSTHVLTSNGVGVAPTFQAATGGLSDIVDDTTPQLGADLDANGFDINIDAGFLLTFDTGTQAQKIVGDAGGLTHTVPDADTHDFIVDATTVLAIAETGLTVTGTTVISGILDVPDIETATVSARDGTLAITIADSTGLATFANVIDVSDIEVATLSARDGTLTQTLADTTGVVTFAAKPVFDVALTILGTIATGTWEGTTVAVAQGGTGVTSSTGTTNVVLSTSPTLVTPVLGTPSSGTLTSCTGLPLAGLVNAAKEETWSFAISDNTTALTTGTKFTWYTPYAITLTDIQASVLTAPTDATLIIDVHEAGTTIMTTNKLDIETAEFHTNTAGTQPAITDTALAAGAKIEFIVDQIGSTVAGAGAIVYLVGYQT